MCREAVLMCINSSVVCEETDPKCGAHATERRKRAALAGLPSDNVIHLRAMDDELRPNHTQMAILFIINGGAVGF